MQRSSSVLLAATFAGLAAPSFGLVRLDGPAGRIASLSVDSRKNLQRSGMPSLTRTEGHVLNSKLEKVGVCRLLQI